VLAINPHSNLALVKLSREKLIEGDPLSAEQLARRALEARPDDSRAWINLGAALENLHHPGEAKKCYEHVVETDQSRDAAGAYSNLAAMNADAGNYGDAIKLYHEALSHDPDLIEAQIGLAEAQRQER
jgi:tetratricopeptide (TPR) repeat protein